MCIFLRCTLLAGSPRRYVRKIHADDVVGRTGRPLRPARQHGRRPGGNRHAHALRQCHRAGRRTAAQVRAHALGPGSARRQGPDGGPTAHSCARRDHRQQADLSRRVPAPARADRRVDLQRRQGDRAEQDRAVCPDAQGRKARRHRRDLGALERAPRSPAALLRDGDRPAERIDRHDHRPHARFDRRSATGRNGWAKNRRPARN